MELRARTRHLARPAAVAALGALLVPALAGTATADAAKRKYPVVRSVTPMDAKLGDTIVLKGRNFLRGKNKNTVVFKRDGARAIFVKSTLGTAKQIRVVLPDSLRQFLADNETARFRVRVLSKRFSKAFTPVSKSPRITALPKPAPAAPGTKGSTDTGSTGTGTPTTPTQVCTGDQDADMLAASLENELGLDSCKADSDGDGVPDGYEYQSAYDLNDDEYQQVNTALPYPGKRPYPNGLFADSGVDYDGDGLPMLDEYRLWDKYGAKPAGGLVTGGYRLLYSDGEQYSLSEREAGTGRRRPSQPAATYAKYTDFLSWAGANGYNPVLVSKAAPWHETANRVAFDVRDVNHSGAVDATGRAGFLSAETVLYDRDNDGYMSDDERDEDADGLTNFDELRGRATRRYWESCYTNEKPYPVEYGDLDLTARDTDGDGIIDGVDDQDHDDLPNIMELSRNMASASGLVDWDSHDGQCIVSEAIPTTVPDGPDPDTNPDPLAYWHEDEYGRVNPYNPCMPYIWSRTCSRTVEFGEKFAPFDGSTDWFALQ